MLLPIVGHPPASQSGGWCLAEFVPETPEGWAGQLRRGLPAASRAPPGCRVQVVIVTPWLLRARICWLAPIEDRVEKDTDPTCAPPCLQAARVTCWVPTAGKAVARLTWGSRSLQQQGAEEVDCP